ncbi:MAG: replication-relaxation family protein [Anaerolineae bacterium]|nr:replication-relaxation family protein [Anaerolineae bacterium]
MNQRLPHFKPAEHPPALQLTQRDGRLMETIYHYEGVLSADQIERLFFTSHRRMQARLSTLYHNRYVDRTNLQEQSALGFVAYFLAEKGIAYLCGLWGISPKELNPREKGERMSLVRHDVRLNEVRMAVMDALRQLPQSELKVWVNSRSFYADNDTIWYLDGKQRKHKRAIRPDAYFYVVSPGVETARHSHFLLELDMRTEHNARFVDEKIRPGLAYFESEAYRNRFGVNAGRYLVVTTGETRLKNMKQQAETVGKAAERFYFTTFEAATANGAFFTQPIWWRPTHDTPVALFSGV